MHAAPTRYQLAEIGSLLADPSRAAILLALVDGRARPAGELARMAGIAPSTASAHLGRLLEGGLLQVLEQGRHRYFRVASDHVAQVLEALPLLRVPHACAPEPAVDTRPLAFARTCYRHLAGRLGVAFYEGLRRQAWIELGEQAVRLSTTGAEALQAAGLLPHGTAGQVLAGRGCLDWTERRFHLGGALGVAVTEQLVRRDWLRRHDGSRALLLTPPGRSGLRRLGIVLDD
ncbi:helix-turn-helix transcriptional regulator [Rhodanobacter sp. DHB23]|uniref:ArsR/SmtB family transcription factor n=1 Tax=Rhodanobacter sp. DHB23 TaxID=2775923 RepID=UPI0017831983|nr:helix-turn-helix transcriptional regulator [Rhodanobacter sp. DHB23]MBD8872712.1 helix-turn-helix transcriptional regulator [Rhodanobacter sp. DHB23]